MYPEANHCIIDEHAGASRGDSRYCQGMDGVNGFWISEEKFKTCASMNRRFFWILKDGEWFNFITFRCQVLDQSWKAGALHRIEKLFGRSFESLDDLRHVVENEWHPPEDPYYRRLPYERFKPSEKKPIIDVIFWHAFDRESPSEYRWTFISHQDIALLLEQHGYHRIRRDNYRRNRPDNAQCLECRALRKRALLEYKLRLKERECLRTARMELKRVRSWLRERREASESLSAESTQAMTSQIS